MLCLCGGNIANKFIQRKTLLANFIHWLDGAAGDTLILMRVVSGSLCLCL